MIVSFPYLYCKENIVLFTTLQLMQYFKKSEGVHSKLKKRCDNVDYYKYEKKGAKIMATLFEQYVAETRIEEEKKGIKNIAEFNFWSFI